MAMRIGDDGSLGTTALDASTLTTREKLELQEFANVQMQKSQMQARIHGLTDTCFRKCVGGKVTQGALDRAEEPCVRNCVDRFMDANAAVVRHLETLRGQ